MNNGKQQPWKFKLEMVQLQQVKGDISRYETAADNPVDWIIKQGRKSNFWLDGRIINSLMFGKQAIAIDMLLHFRKHTGDRPNQQAFCYTNCGKGAEIEQRVEKYKKM